jgi:hypothetical protein
MDVGPFPMKQQKPGEGYDAGWRIADGGLQNVVWLPGDSV